MDDIKAKQQIVEKIKGATNILVTVSNDPSVDALSAAIGLTLLLDKLEKHPTAVFSGTTPPAIAFLEPEKILDDTTDSLRDFIIALDKEKADHLRYKVEGDAVKIFITPYKTTITSDDLQFSQGDFNVELVIALGVDNQDHLDGALEAQGQILHDAAIITVTAGEQTSTLGGIDWHDAQASSLAEMVAGLAEALKDDKTKSLLDGPIATAFLTGIVAETDRFSNSHTTSRAMTVASQLMAAGADQQLIAAKLQETGSSFEPETSKAEAPAEKEAPKDSLAISHEEGETLEEMDKRVKAAEQAEAAEEAKEELAEVKAASAAPEAPVAASSAAISNAYALEPAEKADEPSMGGTLSATTEQASEDSRRELESDQNKTILTHSYVGAPAASAAPLVPPSSDSGHEFIGSASAAGSVSVNEAPAPSTGNLIHSAYAFEAEEPSQAPAEPVPAQNPIVTPSTHLVINPLPAEPSPAPAPIVQPTPPVAPAPADLGLPMPPAVPDFSKPPVVPPPVFPVGTPEAQPEILGDILADPSTPTPPPAPQNDAANPGQFKIPGQ